MSESWASTLLQVTTGLLVFGLGLWAYLLPFGIEQEVKRVIHRNRIFISWELGLAASFYVASILLLMLFPFGVLNKYVALSLRLSDIVIILVALGFLETLWFWLSASRPPTLERVMHALTRLAEKNPERPLIVFAAIDDLVSIGRAAAISHDAISILDGLNHMADFVQKRPAYRGNELQSLIQGAFLIVICERQGYLDEDVAIHGAATFEKIIGNASARGMDSGSDVRRAIQALGRIAMRALCLNADLIASMLVERLGRIRIAGANYALLEVGQEALRRDRFFVALASLRLLERQQGYRGTSSSNACLLGLIASWWMRDGECRGQARACIRRMLSTGIEVSSEMRSAISLFLDRLDYATVDRLRHLDRESIS